MRLKVDSQEKVKKIASSLTVGGVNEKGQSRVRSSTLEPKPSLIITMQIVGSPKVP